ncbi:hypothetical protein Syun_006383 [Stephania yunnanensis]|uniref:Uncharacterized protein n=1 Tax=Stephania yunnanensis TaxID=152371 RepID=A0AAP0PXH7_9MAGN
MIHLMVGYGLFLMWSLIMLRMCSLYVNRDKIFQVRNAGSDASTSGNIANGLGNGSDEMLEDSNISTSGSSFFTKLASALGTAALITVISIAVKLRAKGSHFAGIPGFFSGSLASTLAPDTPSVGFALKFFGYQVVLPAYAPGGVCISDMIPFYLGRLFRQSGASDDLSSKLGIDMEKAVSITETVQKYGNLIGNISRALFAGVCCGGLITLQVQCCHSVRTFGIGFLFRERPMLALASVATIVGIWTAFPYAVAALTAFLLYLSRHCAH